MDKYKAFFDMVNKWTVNDYRTQKIKAEVIVDMLISDFVADIVSYKIGVPTKLIAKEFPIERISQTESEHRYASVDYLLSDMKTNVYLTELKTTNDSFDGIQFLNMLGVCKRGIGALRSPLEYATVDYGIKQRFDKRETKKYLYTIKNMVNCHESNQTDCSCFADKRQDAEEIAKRMINEVFGELETSKPQPQIKILYISLNEISIRDKVEKAKIPYDTMETDILLEPIIISDLIGDNNFFSVLRADKKSAWNLTGKILEELVKPYADWYSITRFE